MSNCDGSVFFTLLSKRLLEYLISNNYMFTRVQKGFLPNVAGYVEHSTLTLSALKDAKHAGKNICVSWIDQRNAFGSIRHSLLHMYNSFLLNTTYLLNLIFNYYESLSACVIHVIKSFTSKPFHYSVGIFQGCTMSPTLFNVTIQLLLCYTRIIKSISNKNERK